MAITTEPIVVEYDPDRFSKAPEIIEGIIRRRLTTLAEYMVAWMKQHGPRDTTLHLESLRYDINSLGNGAFELIITSTAPGAKYALETGRGPGQAPPFENIFGWVQRRGLSDISLGRVRTVGKKIGKTYSQRKNARSVLKRLSTATSEFVEDREIYKKVALRVMRKISKRGTTSKPFLFTEVIDATRSNQTGTWLAIEAEIAAKI